MHDLSVHRRFRGLNFAGMTATPRRNHGLEAYRPSRSASCRRSGRQSVKDRAVAQPPTPNQADDEQPYADNLSELIATSDRAPFPKRVRVVLLLALLSWLIVALFLALVVDIV